MSDDNDLWKNEIKNVQPLRKKSIKSTKLIKKTSKKDQNSHESIKKMQKSPPQGTEMDRRQETRLRRGQINIEGTLDLHGLTRHQAYDRMIDYIQTAFAQKKRCILVITGKGRSGWEEEEIGILRTNLPIWLSEMPLKPLILRHTHAQPRHGGKGAFYVYLRKNKDA